MENTQQHLEFSRQNRVQSKILKLASCDNVQEKMFLHGGISQFGGKQVECSKFLTQTEVNTAIIITIKARLGLGFNSQYLRVKQHKNQS